MNSKILLIAFSLTASAVTLAPTAAANCSPVPQCQYHVGSGADGCSGLYFGADQYEPHWVVAVCSDHECELGTPGTCIVKAACLRSLDCLP